MGVSPKGAPSVLCNRRISEMRTLTSIVALSAALLMAHQAFAAAGVARVCAADI